MKLNRLFFDDPQGGTPGWYADYIDESGEIVGDSMKVWHPDLPTDEDAGVEARSICDDFLASLDDDAAGRKAKTRPMSKAKTKNVPAMPHKKIEKVLPMSGYAYEYDGPKDKWARGSDERWEIDMYDPTGRETLLGKRSIDGVECFVFRSGSKIIAQTAISVRRI